MSIMQRLGQVIGVIVIVSLVVNYYLAIPAVALIITAIWIRNIFMRSSLDIKRYEAQARSPIYAHLVTTFSGLVQIRAYGATRRFERRFAHCLNDHTAVNYLFLSASRVLGIVVELLTCVYVATITVAIMLMPGNNHLSLSMLPKSY